MHSLTHGELYPVVDYIKDKEGDIIVNNLPHKYYIAPR